VQNCRRLDSNGSAGIVLVIRFDWATRIECVMGRFVGSDVWIYRYISLLYQQGVLT